jgi:hypothetical protein
VYCNKDSTKIVFEIFAASTTELPVTAETAAELLLSSYCFLLLTVFPFHSPEIFYFKTSTQIKNIYRRTVLYTVVTVRIYFIENPHYPMILVLLLLYPGTTVRSLGIAAVRANTRMRLRVLSLLSKGGASVPVGSAADENRHFEELE